MYQNRCGCVTASSLVFLCDLWKDLWGLGSLSRVTPRAARTVSAAPVTMAALSASSLEMSATTGRLDAPSTSRDHDTHFQVCVQAPGGAQATFAATSLSSSSGICSGPSIPISDMNLPTSLSPSASMPIRPHTAGTVIPPWESAHCLTRRAPPTFPDAGTVSVHFHRRPNPCSSRRTGRTLSAGRGRTAARTC